ncbi:MAG: type II toxin-antitoxin system RelE/ParE family toxin [Patescibacteria group bacterium]
MTYDVQYHALVVSVDIPALPHEWRDKIKRAIEDRLTMRPEIYGKPLRRSLKGYRKLRVGDYRVIFRIERKSVNVFVIQHRSRVYATADQRL